jgi:hypothetical protein
MTFWTDSSLLSRSGNKPLRKQDGSPDSDASSDLLKPFAADASVSNNKLRSMKLITQSNIQPILDG